MEGRQGLDRLERLNMVLQSNLPDLSARKMGEMEEQGEIFALVFNLPPKQLPPVDPNPSRVAQTLKQPILDPNYYTKSIR
jgi:hypothetical protein